MHVTRLGSGPRVVLVHGSVGNGAATWSEQYVLADRFELVIPDRPGFPPNPLEARVDFEEQAPPIADLLGDGAHLVGHSYGGVISMYAAALRPDAVRSLVLSEPPAFGVARGDPAADAFTAWGIEYWRDGPREPRAFLEGFLRDGDVLERRIDAERAIRAGAGHSIPRAPGFTELLADRLAR